MVGTVIFKNFETGSYKDMILTVYGGSNYADIGNGDFFSCRVCLEEKAICYEYVTREDIEFRNMFDIFTIAAKAREYLFENTHITIAEFCFDGNECVFRPKSFSCGVCEPVDFRTLFNNGGFYMLVKRYREKSPLWMSVFCEIINYCVQKTHNVSIEVFGYSGYGVYLNVSVFQKRMLSSVPERFVNYAKTKDSIRFNPDFGEFVSLEHPLDPPQIASERIMHRFSSLKCDAASYYVEELKDVSDKTEIFDVIKNIAKATFLEHLCDEFVDSLLEFAHFCFEYGYVERLSHIKMLRLKEIMLLNLGILKKEDIAFVAKARSVNRKYIDSRPCVPYIDSDGTAVWE